MQIKPFGQMIPVLSDDINLKQMETLLTPDDIALIIMINGSMSVEGLARLADETPEQLLEQLNILEKKGIIFWKERVKNEAAIKYERVDRIIASQEKLDSISEKKT